ncbi:hypothetical protein ACFX58_12950 [Sphingomonas sp. NCPPB 2930]
MLERIAAAMRKALHDARGDTRVGAALLQKMAQAAGEGVAHAG